MCNRDLQNGIEEMAMGFLAIIGGIVVGIAVTIIMAFCGFFSEPVKADVPVVHTTINRAVEMEREDSGDSELAHIKFVNAVDKVTGWSDLSMDEQAVRVKLAGQIIEAVGKATPKVVDGGFTQSLLRQMGVQMQVQAMAHLHEISPNPLLAFGQGVLLGL